MFQLVELALDSCQTLFNGRGFHSRKIAMARRAAKDGCPEFQIAGYLHGSRQGFASLPLRPFATFAALRLSLFLLGAEV
jgi:hypothetical protein